MRERLLGYWALSWIGLISNIVALPIIALIISFGPPLKVANITLAISLGWPAAREKMGSNFNPSILINGNFWYGSLFGCKAHNS